jgi:hypothetical protein
MEMEFECYTVLGAVTSQRLVKIPKFEEPCYLFSESPLVCE